MSFNRDRHHRPAALEPLEPRQLLSAVSDLDAEAFSPSEVRLTWQHDAPADFGYSIRASRGPGDPFTEVARVPSGTTAALVTGLDAATSYTFHVVPRGGAPWLAPRLTLATPARPGGSPHPVLRRYSVRPLGAVHTADTDHTLIGTMSRLSSPVTAESEAAAVFQMLVGRHLITGPDGDETREYNVRYSGAYRFADAATFLSLPGNDLGGIDPPTKLLVLEDGYKQDGGAADYDDFYWVLDVQVTPLAPTDVTAARDASGRPAITWAYDDPAGGAFQRFDIFRADRPGGELHRVGYVLPGERSFVDTTAVFGRTYTYHVRGAGGAGPGRFSAPATIQTQSVVASGPALVREWEPYTLTLDPRGITGIDRWEIRWGPGHVQYVDGNPATVTYTFPDGWYAAAVRATAFVGDTAFLAPHRRVTIIPAPVAEFTAEAGSGDVRLRWDHDSILDARYTLQRSLDGRAWTTLRHVPSYDPTEIDRHVEEGQSYYYRIRRVIAAGIASTYRTIQVTTEVHAPEIGDAATLSPTSVRVSWADRSDRETAYRIGYSTTPNGPFQFIGRIPAHAGAGRMSHVVTGLQPRTQYYFRVYALGPGGQTTRYTTGSATTDPAGPLPPPPDNLTAERISDSRIDLHWDDIATSETGFRIERGPYGTHGAYETIAVLPPNTTSFSDTSAEPDHSYTYRMVATSNYGDGPWTGGVSVATSVRAPSNLRAIPMPEGDSIQLRWTDHSPNESSFRVYLYRTVDGVETRELIKIAPGMDGADDRVTYVPSEPGVTYTFAVTAHVLNVESEESNRVTITGIEPQAATAEASAAWQWGVPYTLTLRTQHIPDPVTWRVSFNDGSPVQEFTTLDDLVTLDHVFVKPEFEDSRAYRVTATAYWDQWHVVAMDQWVTFSDTPPG